MSSLVIPLVSTTLPTCKPDLMPFHIDYDGPAPVSAFMRVSPLKQEDSPSKIASPAVESEETAENASADAMNVDSATAVAPAKPTATSSTIDASSLQLDFDIVHIHFPATSSSSLTPAPPGLTPAHH
ncbi:hypothetical protein NLJ89_g340 [Agrocybe chaxingu]|uniref:Uncharacterized protein n=1 Tax=Agrocybe chaxingu TaxID=84603 RepID=A0A9W8N268_9AGAR|nr:hypothetical protein NLJ89_g340 [Agrocybe chaxingu]